MPLYLDRHDLPGATAEEVAAAHVQDLNVQGPHDVRYLTYWFEPASGSVFCLAEGPSLDAVESVHREAHGMLASPAGLGLQDLGEEVLGALVGG